LRSSVDYLAISERFRAPDFYTTAMTVTIAIAGFTGKMSRLITDALLRTHPEVKIHGICRSPSKVDPSISSNPNVTIMQAESTDSEAIRAALRGTSVCICCYLNLFDTTFMVEGQKTLIDACIAEDVPRYIASDWCMDFRGLRLGNHPAKDPMKLVHAYLDEKERAGKIRQVHILVGGFMEFFFAGFLGYVDAEKGEFTSYGTGDEKLDMTTWRDSASFTAEVAMDPDANGFLKCESKLEMTSTVRKNIANSWINSSW
jgi:hypothetical protein